MSSSRLLRPKIYLFIARPSINLIGASLVERILLLDERDGCGGREVLRLVRIKTDVLLLGLAKSLHVGPRVAAATASTSGRSQAGDACGRALRVIPILQLTRLVQVRIDLGIKDENESDLS